MGFVKSFDIAVFCFILNQSGQLIVKKPNIFTGLNVFFKALNFAFDRSLRALIIFLVKNKRLACSNCYAVTYYMHTSGNIKYWNYTKNY